jgi:hypothetical protein
MSFFERIVVAERAVAIVVGSSRRTARSADGW